MTLSTNNFIKIEQLLESLNIEIIRTELISSVVDLTNLSEDDVIMSPYLMAIKSLRSELQFALSTLGEIYTDIEKENL